MSPHTIESFRDIEGGRVWLETWPPCEGRAAWTFCATHSGTPAGERAANALVDYREEQLRIAESMIRTPEAQA